MDKLFILLKDGKVLKGIKDKSCSHISIPDSVTSIGRGAFYGCTSLQSIDIPDSVTSIESSALDGTKWYANQPNGMIYINKVLYKLKGETGSKAIAIREGTISISSYSFEGCSSLRSIDIPDSVTEIGWYAFKGCSSLKKIHIHRKNPCDINVDASAFEELYGDCVLLITPGTRWAYRHHPVFGKFKNIET